MSKRHFRPARRSYRRPARGHPRSGQKRRGNSHWSYARRRAAHSRQRMRRAQWTAHMRRKRSASSQALWRNLALPLDLSHIRRSDIRRDGYPCLALNIRLEARSFILSSAHAQGVASFDKCWRNHEREGSMNVRQRNFLLLVTLAAAAATPILGQAAAPTASMPNLSGWGIPPSIPGFEPLASGPTSLTNRSRRDGVNNILQLVGDYTNPILKPEAAAAVKKFGEMSIDHFGFHNPRNQCWPNGVPFVLSVGVQLIQQPDKITML